MADRAEPVAIGLRAIEQTSDTRLGAMPPTKREAGTPANCPTRKESQPDRQAGTAAKKYPEHDDGSGGTITLSSWVALNWGSG
jgi:hypothetical protein